MDETEVGLNVPVARGETLGFQVVEDGTTQVVLFVIGIAKIVEQVFVLVSQPHEPFVGPGGFLITLGVVEVVGR